ncbi:MAG: DUF1295 domain-containing protein [Phycisphaerales bacterium]|nr:MAG: DUF1295 domain-containing protein [Phycisphaerales bacterium]
MEQLLWIALGAFAVMTLGWAWQLRTRNATFIDVLWTGGLAGAAVFAAVAGSGDGTRRFVLALLVVAWGGRLIAHLIGRGALRDPEDPRYTRLREMFPKQQGPIFLIVFWIQALLVAILALPFVFAASDAGAFPRITDVLAVLVWVVAIAGESVADAQLERFRRKPENKGKVCDTGLWRFSRHPNYFFEWLNWCAYALLALGAAGGWIALIAPVLMLLLVTKVSGVPPTERRMLATRGEAFRAYQRRTSAFFPWFPKGAK